MFRRLFNIVLITLMMVGISACTNNAINSQTTVNIDSENQNSRVSILVIHFTTSDFADSLQVLTERTDRPVSSHYLIPEALDESYGSNSIKIHKLVDETSRAWHAGRSRWGNRTALNDQSIGIELVNRAACHKNQNIDAAVDAQSGENAEAKTLPEELCFYPDFSEEQIALLIKLSKGILERHPSISAINVIGHSDIAPARKVDPGPRFPWQRLYNAGIGAWYENDTVLKYWHRFQTQMPEIIAIQKALKVYGYDIQITGENDEQTANVLRAFQMHFNPMMVSQAADLKTAAILFALIERYHGHQLNEICTADESPESTELCPNLNQTAPE